ncbi:MAG: PAS domain-containing protein [Sphaerochaetaceae bacterium]|nr:PAS domain-containing protein [Sphaerochaetaceae bacterium]MDD3162547.1 PAS domain-containing protein [Sphaerochaetaceae bacterium]MDD4006363.1 PAS domain-containing protein [Sphaerochaetaceae bacterium]MDD4396026.1 PAS domain-containing protein [Sphaerochaetaceae bacterium]
MENDSVSLLEIINCSTAGVVVKDPHTFEILFVNQAAIDLFGKPAPGVKCYEYERANSDICDDCPLYHAEYGKDYTTDAPQAALSDYYTICMRLIDWKGKPAVVEFWRKKAGDSRSIEDQKNFIDGIPGGIGIYHFYDNGTIDLVYVNEGYFRMIGQNGIRRKYSGTKVSEAIHPDDRASLGEYMKKQVASGQLIDFDLRIHDGDDHYRWYNIKGRVTERIKDMSVLYASYSDIDQLKTAKLKLEANEKMLETAISSQKMLFWIYDLDSRTVFSEFSSLGKVGLPDVIHDVPDFLVKQGSVLPECADEFCQMYQKILDGADSAESEYKGRNYKDGSVSWNHSVLTRLPDHDGRRTAIGIAMDISLEMDNRLKYENEFKLRQNLISNSFRYIRMNLSSRVVEELHVNGGDSFPKQAPFNVDDSVIDFILEGIPDDYCRKFRDSFSLESLCTAFLAGQSAVSLEYPRVINKETGESHWFRSEANLNLRPDGDIEAFIHSDDIEDEKKNKLAIDSIADEEIESILIVSRITKLVHFVKFNGRTIAKSEIPLKTYLESEVYPFINPDDKKKGRNFFNLDALVRRLEKQDSVELVYSLEYMNASRKKIRAFFLDDSKQDVVFVKRDVTDEYNRTERRHRVLAKALRAAKGQQGKERVHITHEP